jgi:hypothetical protein
MSKTVTILVALFTAIDCNSALAAEPEANHPALTTFILESLPARTGLCVHVGVGDGSLTADLLQGGKFLVHGLDPDAKAVEAVNRMLLGKGVYGQASVEQCDLSTLPYAENVVNLMVVAEADGLNMAEVMRVLAPHGIVMVKGADTSALEGVGFEAVKNAAGWARGRKPRPADMDEWRQYGHDAGRTDLSRDKLVGPPEQLRWLNGPVRGRDQTPPGHSLGGGPTVLFVGHGGTSDERSHAIRVARARRVQRPAALETLRGDLTEAEEGLRLVGIVR